MISWYFRAQKSDVAQTEGGSPSEMTEGLLKEEGGGEENKKIKKSKTTTAVKGRKVRALARTSPFSSSILVSVRKSGWRGRDEAWVHLKEGTALPYSTEFYNTHLQGIFCLNYSRLGVFSNVGDRIELDEPFIEGLLKSNRIVVVKLDDDKSGKVYELKDAVKLRRERAGALLRSIAVLRGGAKQAAFSTDVSPKVIVLAGLSSGNPIFNGLFEDDAVGPVLKIETLREIVKDYAERIVTPVFIGIRKGYLKNENEVYAINGSDINGVRINVMTPIEAADLMASQL